MILAQRSHERRVPPGTRDHRTIERLSPPGVVESRSVHHASLQSVTAVNGVSRLSGITSAPARRTTSESVLADSTHTNCSRIAMAAAAVVGGDAFGTVIAA